MTPAEQSLVEALRRLCAAGSGPSFWFLPTQTWFCSGFQRPQQMARALAETGCPVVFSEPWHCNAVWLTAATRKERECEGLRQLAENLWLLRCPQERIRPFLEAAPPGAVVMSWPYQDCFARGLTGSLVIYEMG